MKGSKDDDYQAVDQFGQPNPGNNIPTNPDHVSNSSAGNPIFVISVLSLLVGH